MRAFAPVLCLLLGCLASPTPAPRDDCGSACVGVLYETWFDQLCAGGDSSRCPPVYPSANPPMTYRCWGTPALGQYASSNMTVAAIHAQQIAAAGIDFIIVDYSNSNILNPELDGPLLALLQLYTTRRAAKQPTPRVTFLIPPEEAQLSKLWSTYYSASASAVDPDVFFHYDDGRPLLMTDGDCTAPSCAHFNVRPTAALRNPTTMWSFMDLYPQPAVLYEGKPEQMAVSAAQQETYMSIAATAHGRSYNHRTRANDGYPGQNFDDQWARAREQQVRVVVTKSWNEWCSIRTAANASAVPDGHYTDEYSPAFSNDIEPQAGGLGDSYLVNMTAHIALFKEQAKGRWIDDAAVAAVAAVAAAATGGSPAAAAATGGSPAALHSPPTPPPPIPDPGTVMTKIEIPGAAAAGALYPDGSPAFYTMNYRANATGWVVHMSGGGWNFLKNELLLNGEDKDGDLADRGTFHSDGIADDDHAVGSKSAGCYGICDGIMSNLPEANPDFHGYNKVFIPIGDRTSFTADRWEGKPLFRGKRILDAALGDMLTRYNMSRATDIILTGGSSGGLAVYLNCDRVGEMIAAAAATTTTTTTTTATAPRYACLADAGFFLDHNNTAGGPTTSPQFRESFYAWNSTAAINQDCIKHYTALGEPWRCVFAQNVLPFIKSRLFVMQNLFDSWQMANILGIRCTTYNKDLSACGASDMAAIESYGQTMRGLLAAAPAGYGIFAPSCIAHCQSVENEHPAALWHWPGRWGIDIGATAATATAYPRETFGAWYFQRNTGPAQVQQACDWGPHCNPLCPLFT